VENFLKFFLGIYINSYLPNKKFKVALTYNLKPEEKENFVPDNFPQNSTDQKFDDKYAEWDTLETINAVKKALEIYHEVIMIEADIDAYDKFRTEQPDIVFNIAEGVNGISREAQIPAMLDLLSIPYSGSNPLTLSLCLDKARTKEILSYHNIPTSKFLKAKSLDDLQNFDLKFPIILKPLGEGSSKGIFNSSFISEYNELQKRLSEMLSHYQQPFIIEEYLPGREFTVAVLGNDDEIKILPIVEINFSELPEGIVPIYSYEAKWVLDTKANPLDIFTCPAKLDVETANSINEIVKKTYNVLECRDWSRIDVRLDSEGVPNIVEVNPLPGILPEVDDNSCFPKAARAAGYKYEEMINSVLFAAAKRNKLL